MIRYLTQWYVLQYVVANAGRWYKITCSKCYKEQGHLQKGKVWCLNIRSYHLDILIGILLMVKTVKESTCFSSKQCSLLKSLLGMLQGIGLIIMTMGLLWRLWRHIRNQTFPDFGATCASAWNKDTSATNKPMLLQNRRFAQVASPISSIQNARKVCITQMSNVLQGSKVHLVWTTLIPWVDSLLGWITLDKKS